MKCCITWIHIHEVCTIGSSPSAADFFFTELPLIKVCICAFVINSDLT